MAFALVERTAFRFKKGRQTPLTNPPRLNCSINWSKVWCFGCLLIIVRSQPVQYLHGCSRAGPNFHLGDCVKCAPGLSYVVKWSLCRPHVLPLSSLAEQIKYQQKLCHACWWQILFVNVCYCVRLNFKGKSPLAAMTSESTQPTLTTTVQYSTFVLESLRSSQHAIAGKDPRWSRNSVTESQITLARASCNIVAYLQRRS